MRPGFQIIGCDKITAKESRSHNLMIAISLQSGSNGNCTYVETSGVRLLFDAGICGVAAERRLAAFGRDIRKTDAVIISHDHSDHVRYAGVFQRKYGLPLYFTEATLETAVSNHPLGRMDKINLFKAGQIIHFKDISVISIPTPHDSADGVAFVIQSGRKRLGILTDLGHPFQGLAKMVSSLDAVFIESNYDTDMLKEGRYPAFLKKRIHGPGGHISNMESAELLRGAPRLKWACLSHLSEENNAPDLALCTHRRIINRDLTLHVASRYGATGIFHLL